MSKKRYRFISAESAIQVELFLPKKSNYQGILYDTLVNGLNLHKPVKFKTTNGLIYKTGFEIHFKEDKKREKSIKKLLKEYKIVTKYYDEFVNRGEQIFYGYSIYEVDGVFSGVSGVYEERTNVVKMIFKPDFIGLSQSGKFGINFKQMRRISRRYFGLSNIGKKEYLKKYPKIKKNEEKLKFLIYLHKWQVYVGFFLFGFILHELALGENNIEEEIWVTSVWGMRINRVVNINNE